MKPGSRIMPGTKLSDFLQAELKKKNLWSVDVDLRSELPQKWEKHGDLVLFPATAFSSPIWKTPIEPKPKAEDIDKICQDQDANTKDLLPLPPNPGDVIWPLICSKLNVKTIARKTGPIQSDGFRRPAVELLFGNDPWVTKKENGILYSWDITKTMFCSGNISEKQRLAEMNCEGQNVVDLYAGIGYFTLTYLVHSKAEKVYAIDWNEDSIHALGINVRQNHVEDKCVILHGNNLEVCPQDVADHVNLGLIPSSEQSWTVACKALKHSTGGILHIHGNVEFKPKSKSKVKRKFPEEEQEDDEENLNTQGDDNGNGNSDSDDPEVEGSGAGGCPWLLWTNETVNKITRILNFLHLAKEPWVVEVLFLHKVKSYGPHIDHLVLDLKCSPKMLLLPDQMNKST